MEGHGNGSTLRLYDGDGEPLLIDLLIDRIQLSSELRVLTVVISDYDYRNLDTQRRIRLDDAIALLSEFLAYNRSHYPFHTENTLSVAQTTRVPPLFSTLPNSLRVAMN